jgi:hypothetical protein
MRGVCDEPQAGFFLRRQARATVQAGDRQAALAVVPDFHRLVRLAGLDSGAHGGKGAVATREV